MKYLIQNKILAQELHPDLNNHIEDIGKIKNKSSVQLWWICENMHSWLASPEYRNRGFGNCHVCVSLKFLYPHIAKEIHPTKNEQPITVIENLKYGSGKKVWWIGSNCAHEWEMNVNSRTSHKQNCPYCCGRKLLSGFNDLYTKYPQIAKQIDGNKDITKKIYFSSNTQLVWICENNHKWEASPSERINNIKKCRECNSINFLYPEIIQFWDFKKNPKQPSALAPHSKSKYYWTNTKCNHTWQTTASSIISSYNKTKNICYICSNIVILKGFNDLSTTHPELIDQWDFKKNKKYSPDTITRGSNIKIWWLCEKKKHSWLATVNDRQKGTGCPKCLNYISKLEKEIADMLVKNGITVITQYKGLLTNPRASLDIFLKDYNIAIEFNGNYWHSEKFRKKEHHSNRFKECLDKGIRLIQIWEYEWIQEQEKITHFILSAIQKSLKKKLITKRNHNTSIIYEESKNNVTGALKFKTKKEVLYIYDITGIYNNNIEILNKEILHIEQYHRTNKTILISNNCKFDNISFSMAKKFTSFTHENPKEKYLYNNLIYTEHELAENEIDRTKALKIWDSGYTKWIK